MRLPDLTNEAGTIRAWRWTPPAPGVGPEGWQAGIATWLIEADGPLLDPWNLFHQWFVGCIRLDDRPGWPPAHRQYPDAQFELTCITIQPGKGVTADLFDERAAKGDAKVGPKGIFMTPADIVFQWHGTTDEQANGVCESFVRAVVLGGLSPNRPAITELYTLDKLTFDAAWAERLQATVQHFLTGHWNDPQEHRA